jgi:hypothetical protein
MCVCVCVGAREQACSRTTHTRTHAETKFVKLKHAGTPTTKTQTSRVAMYGKIKNAKFCQKDQFIK